MSCKIESKQLCDRCGKKFFIGNLEICGKCKTKYCEKCKLFLSRTSEEVNHEYHYKCFNEKKRGDEPGEFVHLYVDPNKGKKLKI